MPPHDSTQVILAAGISASALSSEPESKELLSAPTLSIGSRNYSHQEILDKLNSIQEAAKHCDIQRDPSNCRNVTKLFGESTELFLTIEELENFLIVESDRAHWLRSETLNAIRVIKEALAQYEVWKLNKFIFKHPADEKSKEEQNILSEVMAKVDLLNATARKQEEETASVIAITQGLEKIKEEMTKAADVVSETLSKDEDIIKKRQELALTLLRMTLDIVNGSVAAEFLWLLTDRALGGGGTSDTNLKNIYVDGLVSYVGYEIGYDISYNRLQSPVIDIKGKRISKTTINNLMSFLWDISLNTIQRYIELAQRTDKPLSREELVAEIEKITKGPLKEALRKHEDPSHFDCVEFVAHEMARKMKQNNDALIAETLSCFTEVQQVAMDISGKEGFNLAKAIHNSMVRYCIAGSLCRDYYKGKHKKESYEEVKHPENHFHGFKAMKKKSSKTVQYFPDDFNPLVLMLLNPTAGKDGAMHIGGKNLRELAYGLEDFTAPEYGYLKKGKYGNKARIKDTWRSEIIIQECMTRVSTGIKIPFPILKSAKEVGDTVIEILKLNEFFHPATSSKQSDRPTPLYLFTHMKYYSQLLEKPGVKEYLRDRIDIRFLMQCFHDPNVNNDADKSRMMQAYNDTLKLLEIIGVKAELLKEFQEKCVDFINLQCDQARNKAQINFLEEVMFAHLTHCESERFNRKELQDFRDRLQVHHEDFVSLENHEKKLNKAHPTSKSIHQPLVEELIMGYLDPNHMNDKDKHQLFSVLHNALKGRTTLEHQKVVKQQLANNRKMPEDQERSKIIHESFKQRMMETKLDTRLKGYRSQCKQVKTVDVSPSDKAKTEKPSVKVVSRPFILDAANSKMFGGDDQKRSETVSFAATRSPR